MMGASITGPVAQASLPRPTRAVHQAAPCAGHAGLRTLPRRLACRRHSSQPPASPSTCGLRSARRLVVAAARQAGARETLPIFPLSVVALPSADVPLQIFEARYRVLFNTLLAGSDGLEDGLINPDKAWCGSRRFGMSFYDPRSSGLASIGTVLEIKRHERLDDGRLLVENVGRERFRIVKVVEERPVLVCEVEYLPSEPEESHSPEVRALAKEVAELFRNVVQLAVKLRDTSLAQEVANPAQLTELGPTQMSFWVASLFGGNPYQQQALLEMDSTEERLKEEKEMLSGTLKYLSAQAALQGAFRSASTGSGESPVPPPGGPD